MAVLDVDKQLHVLCDRLEKDPIQVIEKAEPGYTQSVLHWLEQYLYIASPEAQHRAYQVVEAALGINLAQTIGRIHDPGPEPLLSPVFPTTGWLGKYLEYTDRHEAPDLFHFWIGVSIIHAAVRRNIWFEHGYYRIFPNSYVILVAPPGACKKSTATNIGVEILQEIEDVTIIREKITPEALIETLAATTRLKTKGGMVLTPSACAFVHAPELGVFLGREKYNEGLISLLTTLFDCHTKWEYTTRGAGKLVLHNLHITLLGATTPEHISSSIPESAMGGGLLSRVVFASKDRTPRCEPFPVVRDPLVREQLIAMLQAIAQREGQVVQSAAGMSWCEEWYIRNRKVQYEDLALSGYYERKQSHLIKLAMTLLISEGEDLIITPEVYQQALNILEFTELTMPSALSRVQKSIVGQEHEAIIRHLQRAGGRMSHSDLLRKMYGRMDAKKFAAAIQTLREARLLEAVFTKTRQEYVLIPKGLQ